MSSGLLWQRSAGAAFTEFGRAFKLFSSRWADLQRRSHRPRASGVTASAVFSIYLLGLDHVASSKSPRKGAQPHQRTRRDHSNETAEDYVEAIAEILAQKNECRAVDLAAHFGVSHVTVNRIVARLSGEGLLETLPYRPISLTAQGKRLAIASRKRHEIVHNFLLAIGVDEATAALDTEGIEHHVSPTTLAKLEQLTKSLTR